MKALAAKPIGRLPPRADMAYLCTRLRARLPDLIAADDWDALRTLPSLAELHHRLLETPYERRLRARVLDLGSLDELESALTDVLIERVGDVAELVAHSAPEYLYLVVGSWDAHHLRSLVRWHVARGDEAAAREAFVAAGTLGPEVYRGAMAAGSLSELCRDLSPWLPDAARDLEQCLLQGKEEPSLRQVELVLEQSHLRRLLVCAEAAATQADAEIIRRLAALEIDMANLRTSLRLLGRHVAREEVARYYLPGGSIGDEQFTAMMSADAIEQVYRRLPNGPLTAAMNKGMLSFAGTGRASVFERPLDDERLRLLKMLSRLEPVSVALPLDFLERSRNEWINLKTIARGIAYRLPPGKVQESLVYG